MPLVGALTEMRLYHIIDIIKDLAIFSQFPRFVPPKWGINQIYTALPIPHG